MKLRVLEGVPWRGCVKACIKEYFDSKDDIVEVAKDDAHRRFAKPKNTLGMETVIPFNIIR